MVKLHHDLAYTYVESPIGSLLLAGDGERLHLISFPGGSRTRQPKTSWRRDDAIFDRVSEELNAYFAREITEFSVRLKLTGTEFQKTVWKALLTIRSVINGIKSLFHPAKRNAEIGAEVWSFFDSAVEHKMRQGMSRNDGVMPPARAT